MYVRLVTVNLIVRYYLLNLKSHHLFVCTGFLHFSKWFVMKLYSLAPLLPLVKGRGVGVCHEFPRDVGGGNLGENHFGSDGTFCATVKDVIYSYSLNKEFLALSLISSGS